MNTTNHHHVRRLVVAGLGAAATAGVAVGASSSASAAGLACGTVVTEDVQLEADLTGCGEVGLVVGAPGITIDLAGHTLAGTGVGPGIDANGGHDRLSVVGGTITGFTIGIELLENDGSRVEGMTLTGNMVGMAVGRSTGVLVEGVHADGNGFGGVEIGFSRATSVRDSSMSDNGFSGLDDIGSTGTRVERSVTDGNGAFGIRLLHGDDAAVRRNQSHGNDGTGIEVGFDTVGSVIERNDVRANTGYGILVVEPDNTVRRNIISGNAEGDCEPVTACD